MHFSVTKVVSIQSGSWGGWRQKPLLNWAASCQFGQRGGLFWSANLPPQRVHLGAIHTNENNLFFPPPSSASFHPSSYSRPIGGPWHSPKMEKKRQSMRIKLERCKQTDSRRRNRTQEEERLNIFCGTNTSMSAIVVVMRRRGVQRSKGGAMKSSFWTVCRFTVHMKTGGMRFLIFPPWDPFLKKCVFRRCVFRIRVDVRPNDAIHVRFHKRAFLNGRPLTSTSTAIQIRGVNVPAIAWDGRRCQWLALLWDPQLGTAVGQQSDHHLIPKHQDEQLDCCWDQGDASISSITVASVVVAAS